MELEPTIHEIIEECLNVVDSDSSHSSESMVSSRSCQSSRSSRQGSFMLQPMDMEVSDRTARP